jgi:hypothetical protein
MSYNCKCVVLSKRDTGSVCEVCNEIGSFIKCKECKGTICPVCDSDYGIQICNQDLCMRCIDFKMSMSSEKTPSGCVECYEFIKTHCTTCETCLNCAKENGISFFQCIVCKMYKHSGCSGNSTCNPNICQTCDVVKWRKCRCPPDICDLCNQTVSEKCFDCGMCITCLQYRNVSYTRCKKCNELCCNCTGSSKQCCEDICKDCRNDSFSIYECNSCHELFCNDCDDTGIFISLESKYDNGNGLCSDCNGRNDLKKVKLENIRLKDYIRKLLLSESMNGPLYDENVSNIIIKF